MSEEIELTPEQIATYERKKAEAARQQAEVERQQAEMCVRLINELADKYGYVITAVPIQVQDGRTGVIAISAQLALQKKVQ